MNDRQPPTVLIGAHVPAWEDGSAGIAPTLAVPDPSRKVTFTRSIYLYPRYARYGGHGNVNDAKTFRSAGAD